ncbi:hypothetical protein DKG77_04435 [Flagellimonas aquimarina]|jgi:hypothetical protein|uniref:Knr4/Smi1-like domain-containing protein n=1 Tax=Flagellimonas aquimarina TaxID=2201895 RepID=A0A316L574_9FLAO|nr:SMI1/KNR4 family protein [Allomuricauda koreensis]PWL40079.1 hypothetical protein DKG77_04435 [Allomuricauda koreensis]
MTNFSKQIDSIKKKLTQAKQVDADLKVFGAGGHRYEIYSPVSLAQVEFFEKEYSIQLPSCYRAFVLQVGNGGTSYKNSGAGPFYGIYPFGENVDDLIYGNPEKYLKEPCVLKPTVTNKYWENMTNIFFDENISDNDYYSAIGKIYSGILPIGFQGCSYLHALVLNGMYKGKVVNLEMSAEQAPKFAHEKNFLDWYERWLDEVISGKLITVSPSWFGYAKKN